MHSPTDPDPSGFHRHRDSRSGAKDQPSPAGEGEVSSSAERDAASAMPQSGSDRTLLSSARELMPNFRYTFRR